VLYPADAEWFGQLDAEGGSRCDAEYRTGQAGGVPRLRDPALMARQSALQVTGALEAHVRATWAIVLAAGEGTRLSTLTRNSHGVAVPKQFCSLTGGATLLQDTLQRARGIAADECVAVVVAAQHRRWWRGTIQSIPGVHAIVQPENRGTANGILLATLTIAMRDPLARLVFLPSDHFVARESLFARALQATASSRLPPGEILLLGVEPNAPDPELGYVMPHALSRIHDGRRVDRFVEKPAISVAAALIADGALWNSFIFVAEVATIIDLMRSRYPGIVDDFETALQRGPDAVAELYERLPTLDFSRAILQGAESRLSVLRAPECGWSDLGTPRRVAACLERLTDRSVFSAAALTADAVNLAAAVTPTLYLSL